MVYGYQTSSIHNTKPIPASETPNQKNNENVARGMGTSNSQSVNEMSKMEVSYAAAQREYKNGNVKEGDAKLQEGRDAAEQAHKEVFKETEKIADKYEEKADVARNNGDMKAAKAYLEERDKVRSEAVERHNKIDEAKNKAEERAQEQKENYERTR